MNLNFRKKTTPTRFELARAEPIGFQNQLLNHSDTVPSDSSKFGRVVKALALGASLERGTGSNPVACIFLPLNNAASSDGVVGYHARLTRARSRVRSSVRTFLMGRSRGEKKAPEVRLELTTYRLTAGRATDCAIQELASLNPDKPD